MSKRQRKRKPAKTRKPLTARKAISEQNKGFTDRIIEFLKDIQEQVKAMEQRVAQSNQQLWENQRQQKAGLDVAQEELLITRRILNDALCGCTRVVRIDRRLVEREEEHEETQLIDFEWYVKQLQNSDSQAAFMTGTVVPDAEVEKKIERKEIQRCVTQLRALSHRALGEKKDDVLEILARYEIEEQKEEAAEQAAELLRGLAPENFQWLPRMDTMAIAQLRSVNEQMIIRAHRTRTATAIMKLIKEHEQDARDICEREDTEALMSWLEEEKKETAEKSEAVDWDIDTDFAMAELKRQVERLPKPKIDPDENPEAVDEAIKQFQEDMADVAAIAEEAKKAVMDGDEESAKEKMAELAKKVEDEEGKFPDGAAIFGGQSG